MPRSDRASDPRSSLGGLKAGHLAQFIRFPRFTAIGDPHLILDSDKRHRAARYAARARSVATRYMLVRPLDRRGKTRVDQIQVSGTQDYADLAMPFDAMLATLASRPSSYRHGGIAA